MENFNDETVEFYEKIKNSNYKNLYDNIDIDSAYINVKRHTLKNKRRKRLIFSISTVAAIFFIFLSIYSLRITNEHQNSVVTSLLLCDNLEAKYIIIDSISYDMSNISKIILADNGILTQSKEGKAIFHSLFLKNNNVTIKVPYGDVLSVVLADGTDISINSNSILSFPYVFSDSLRRVAINGEATFDVKSNEKAPFIVETSNINIKVTGTLFNVFAYDTSDDIVTTLIHGAITIIDRDNLISDINLVPNEQFELSKSTGKYSVRSIDASKSIAWNSNRLVYKDIRLGDLMNNLKLLYCFDYEFSDQNMAEIRISLNVDKSDNIDEIIEIITKLKKISIKKEGDNYLIY